MRQRSSKEVIKVIKLSPKFKDFLLTETKRDYLEGTTAAGKTTVGITKFMLMVAKSEKKYHLLCGLDLGTVEKNVINSECGLLAQFGVLANYYSNGKGRIGLPHIVYDTPTGENGNLLSGGERQRISIARAILKNSPILLLDEATASLDIENELAVKQAIANLLKEKKTVVMIAHTLSIVKMQIRYLLWRTAELQNLAHMTSF